MFQDRAACTPADEHVMFSELASKVAKAKAICGRCPVTEQCLRFALDNSIEFGIFGGKTPEERKNLILIKNTRSVCPNSLMEAMNV
jgi:WhiB family redox-sensing transcriptional regulator